MYDRRSWVTRSGDRTRVFIDTNASHSTLPSCPFFLRVKVPTQPSLPASFLFKVPVGELGGLPDAMFVCQKLVDSVWNNSCFYWLMWSAPIGIIVILETVGTGIPLPSHQPNNLWEIRATKREELPFFNLVNSTTSFLLWKQKKCTTTFLIRRARRKMNNNFFIEALFDSGGVRLSLVWISNPFVSDRVLKINPCAFLPCCHTFVPSLCRLLPFQLTYVALLRLCLLSEFYPDMASKSILTLSWIIFEVERFELRGPEPGCNHFLLFCFVLLCVQSVIFHSQNRSVIVYFS